MEQEKIYVIILIVGFIIGYIFSGIGIIVDTIEEYRHKRVIKKLKREKEKLSE